MNIIEQSKILGEYLGWKYIPHNSLEEFTKAGWWKPVLEVKEPVTVEGVGTFRAVYPQKIVSGGIEKGKWWWKHVCRSHKDLRFYNSMDWLIKVLEMLTKEDLSEYMYSWERCVEGDEEDCETEVCYNFMNIDYYISMEFGTIIEINLELDPVMEIGRGQGEDIVKNTFNACVEAVEYINKRKK